MTSYLYGSSEAVEAFVRAVEDHPSHSHLFSESEEGSKHLANALETAFFAGSVWAEDYTGIPIQESSEWPEALLVLDLSCNQLVGLIYALRQAMELGDDWAPRWLSQHAQSYGVEWV
jgi:hypothetical protein